MVSEREATICKVPCSCSPFLMDAQQFDSRVSGALKTVWLWCGDRGPAITPVRR
jgi:hypothetical protein